MKKYFWLKLKTDFFLNPKIKKLRRIPGGDTYTIIYQKLMLLSVATEGVLVLEGIESKLEDELSLILDETPESIQICWAFLLANKLVEEITNLEFFLPSVPLLTGSESDSAERVRQFRQRKALQCNAQVTQGNEKVTTELELEKNLEQELSPTSLKNQRETKINFQEFRNRLAEGGFTFELTQNIAGYAPETKFKVKSTGYIHCLKSQKDVSSEDAQALWDFLYQRRSAVLAALEKSKTKKEDVA